MFRLVIALAAALAATAAVDAQKSTNTPNLTYRELLGDERIGHIVRYELGALPDAIEREVRITPGTVSWSVQRIGAVRSRSSELPVAVREIHKEYREFLAELAEFSRKGDEVAVISPATGEAYLSAAKRCGKIPCSKGCCEYCDPCK